MGIDDDATVPRDRQFGEEGRRLSYGGRLRLVEQVEVLGDDDAPRTFLRSGPMSRRPEVFSPYGHVRSEMYYFPLSWELKAWLQPRHG
ncbi:MULTISPECIES: hypothetical protein [Nonomuraea]|uniref:Uncharacterized protein n=2 Tax=Nonomuraea TaxID=83681 RepID=A0ABW1BS98_9ACTN|nr:MULTISPECIES: hypothetical protein [Nonomuraea]MDA0642085.1 hypothetical protein [Nonomuraea ferruginea]TXK43397.1 hypothetical protein FR742_30855 [Nonomuraea sp. C10]